MATPKSKSPRSGLSPVLALALVIVAFFAGRFITLPGELPVPSNGVSPLQAGTGAHRTSLAMAHRSGYGVGSCPTSFAAAAAAAAA